MKKRIAVLTGDAYLFQKIYLILSQDHVCERIFGARADGYDLCLFDARYGGAAPLGARAVEMSDKGRLKIPFSQSELISLVESAERAPELTLGERCAYFKGEEIKLSELEFSLLSLLVAADGEFVMREKILEQVWHSEKDGGIINVYVHYLREKLEACGDKVIISSRSHGYKIDGRFLRKEGAPSALS